MIAVIFEVLPKSEHAHTYFEIAADLRTELNKIDGFISVERFESLSQKGKFLSLSFFQDEAAVVNWRSHMDHREAQNRGKNELFTGYRIRVAEILRYYGHGGLDVSPSP